MAKKGKNSWPKGESVDPNRNEPNGTEYQTFSSKVLGAKVSYLIYLPPGYEQETKRYPVIYWLHGLGGNQRGGATSFVPQVDNAIRKGALPPAIVVVVNGRVSSFYCDWANGKLPIESVIVQDLIPHIDKTYRTVAQRQGRVIQGYSMGGYGAAHLAFKYPEVFGAVVVDAAHWWVGCPTRSQSGRAVQGYLRRRQGAFPGRASKSAGREKCGQDSQPDEYPYRRWQRRWAVVQKPRVA